LAEGCYIAMFSNCKNLTTAPELPAQTVVRNAYQMMFNGCSSLNYIKTYASSISAYGCLTNWVQGVASTGDFYNLGGATYTSGKNGIPTGWTVHTSL